MISDDLARFLEGGVGIHLATRDAHLEPGATTVWAVKVDPDREHVTAYVHRTAAKRALADLAENGQASLGFGRPTDDRACQVKGVFVEKRACEAREKALVTAQLDGFRKELEAIGIPKALTAGWKAWPCVAVRIRVTALFSQTPGPGAGERMP